VVYETGGKRYKAVAADEEEMFNFPSGSAAIGCGVSHGRCPMVVPRHEGQMTPAAFRLA